ncbi:MAG TPA: DUF3795 domain-containing protein [bacterium]|nr:DUF3795 domain-containing protein [bacterium]
MAGNVRQGSGPVNAPPKDLGGVCGMYWEGNPAYEVWRGTCTPQAQAGAGTVCPVCACAREREVAHCGVCSEFPCALLMKLAAETGPGDRRIDSATYRAEAGDDRWAEWAREREIWRGAFCPLLQRGYES